MIEKETPEMTELVYLFDWQDTSLLRGVLLRIPA